jgi:MFS family permease
MAWGGNQFTPLLAMYRNLEGYSATQVNLFLAMYVVALVPGFLLVGPVSRRFGRRSMAAAGLLTGAVASVVLAVGAGSPVALCAGRFLVGASVAVAMVVGTTWIDELTGPAAPRGVAARRAAGTLTLGFAAGAATAGVLAQWGPQPRVTPYVVHLALSAVAGVLLVGSSDTLPAARREPDARPEVRLPG